jgi:hypothetical protein
MATITQNNTLAALILAAGLGPVAAQDAALETQIVDAMNKVYGVHPGFRANHAKGVVCEGTFMATPDAARLSKAVIFNGSPILYASRIRRAFLICPMALLWLIRTEWRSNFTYRTAAKPTW